MSYEKNIYVGSIGNNGNNSGGGVVLIYVFRIL